MEKISHIAADLTPEQRVELERLVYDLVRVCQEITEFERRLLERGQIDG